MPSPLQGKVVLITGAARGIGAETARLLAGRGARLVLTDVDAEALAGLAGGLGPDVLTVTCDVRDLSAMQEAVARGVERFGGLDAVLANAGIVSYGTVGVVDPEAFKRVLDINVLGVFHTVRAALPAIVESRGYVLVVSSLAAFAASPGLAAYHASKAAAEHFGNSLRLEVAHLGVDVGTAHMSWIDTPLLQDAMADLPAFRQMVARLPGPLSRTTSVEACAAGFVKALEGRKRHVYVPGWVGAVREVRNLLNSRMGERETLKHTAELVPQMDAQVRALGRSTSVRNVGR